MLITCQYDNATILNSITPHGQRNNREFGDFTDKQESLRCFTNRNVYSVFYP